MKHLLNTREAALYLTELTGYVFDAASVRRQLRMGQLPGDVNEAYYVLNKKDLEKWAHDFNGFSKGGRPRGKKDTYKRPAENYKNRWLGIKKTDKTDLGPLFLIKDG